MRAPRTSCSALILSAALLTLCLGGAASAEPTHGSLLAYGKVGGLIPVTALSPHVSFRLGGGYLLPVLAGRLGVVADLGYSQTSADGTVSDPRILADQAQFSYELTQRDLNLFVGPQYYFMDPQGWLAPYAAVGLDLHFLESVVEGQGGDSPLGENSETSTKAGFAARAGAGYRLGPGLITGEVTFAWAPIDHAITGDSHLGRIALLVGYTAVFALNR